MWENSLLSSRQTAEMRAASATNKYALHSKQFASIPFDINSFGLELCALDGQLTNNEERYILVCVGVAVGE
jgi:hypothetical protein